jgi:hypothetical protein
MSLFSLQRVTLELLLRQVLKSSPCVRQKPCKMAQLEGLDPSFANPSSTPYNIVL